jgi:amino acid permease
LLLFAGTTVGAGAVALPAETADTGFVPLTLGLLLS